MHTPLPRHMITCIAPSPRVAPVYQLMNEFTNMSGQKDVGRLMMIDLGGSESMEGASGPMLMDARRLETKNLNQSMLTFGRVLQGLVEGAQRIPYRDSKLTRLVSEALGGFCRTNIIATLSPARTAEEETKSTLHYAQLARRIYNKPQGNTLKRVIIELANTHSVYQRELETERQRYRQLAVRAGGTCRCGVCS